MRVSILGRQLDWIDASRAGLREHKTIDADSDFSRELICEIADWRGR